MRSSAAIRTMPCRSRRSSRMPAARRSSPTPAATASSSRCSTSTCAAASSPTGATGCCRCSPNLLPADKEMDAYIAKVRAPYEAKLAEKLAVTEGLLYRRGNFNGSFDQLIVDALRASARCRHRILSGLPLGHDAAARRSDHRRAPDGPDGDHLSGGDAQRDDRRDDQDRARGRRRQPVQSRSVPAAGRRHGARRRPAVLDRSQRDDRQAHRRPAHRRQAAGGRAGPTRSRAGPRCRRTRKDRRCGTWSRSTCASARRSSR